jgi:ATP/maltotriose-dependent transcriptional regulator MalT
LGMTSQINGDLFQAASHYKRAVELFHELDDRRGLVSSLATLALCGPSYIHDSSLTPFNLNEAIEKGEQALKLAQQIGWRSGEIYAYHCLSICLGPQGAVQRAFELTQHSLEISEEIGHDQWLIGAHFDLGVLHLEIFALSQARQHLELALTLAKEIGSSLWIGTVIGYLASVCILQNDLSGAEAILATELTADTPAQNQMQRLCWCARAELALARGEPDLALSIADRLIASDPNMAPATSIPRLSRLRSEALIVLKRTKEAERELRLAQKSATEQGTRSWSWRIQLELGKLYQSQGRRVEAEAEFGAAQNISDVVIAEIQNPALHEIFQARAALELHRSAPVSPRQMEKEKFGGLTAREREVAALIAQGQSNREIAETLVVSERTVESHVTNILAKLNFPSRASIAVWVVEKGLGKRAE